MKHKTLLTSGTGEMDYLRDAMASRKGIIIAGVKEHIANEKWADAGRRSWEGRKEGIPEADVAVFFALNEQAERDMKNKEIWSLQVERFFVNEHKRPDLFGLYSELTKDAKKLDLEKKRLFDRYGVERR